MAIYGPVRWLSVFSTIVLALASFQVTARDAPPLESVRERAMKGIKLVVGGAGYTGGYQHIIEVDAEKTLISVKSWGAPDSEVAEGPGESEVSERLLRTNLFEWRRLCRFVEASGLFDETGRHLLQKGSHAGFALVVVTFDSGETSSVVHEAFFSMEEPLMFWAVIRAIEGGAQHAQPQ